MSASQTDTEARTDRTRAGIGLACVTAVVSGVSVFVNASAVKAFSDPVLFTSLKNGVAAVVLLALALGAGPTAWQQARRGWPALLLIGVIGGGVPFILFFSGLAEATAPAAAVIHKTLFLWVALLAVVFLRERLGGLQIAALGVLLLSQLLIQNPAGVGWGSGETLIALATGLWAVEVIVAKRLLRSVPAAVAAAGRMSIGLVVLVAYLAVSGALGAVPALAPQQWAWVFGTGLLLSAYVATWYAALQRAPAVAVTAVLTLGAPITAVLQLVTAGQVPAPAVAVGYGAGLLAAVGLAWLAAGSRRQVASAAAVTR
jgi:drug/metabolite transporter (DMT)-like permease